MKPVSDLDKYLTPEQHARVKRMVDEERPDIERRIAMWNACSEACDRVTGTRPAPPDVYIDELTDDFTEAQWAEFKRLSKQLCAERGVEVAVDEELDSWREDLEEQRREIEKDTERLGVPVQRNFETKARSPGTISSQK